MVRITRLLILAALLQLAGRAQCADSAAASGNPPARLVAVKCLGKPGVKASPLSEAQITELLQYLNRPFHGVIPATSPSEIVRLLKGFDSVSEAVLCYADAMTEGGKENAEKNEPKTETTTLTLEPAATEKPPARGGKRELTRQETGARVAIQIPLANDIGTMVGTDMKLPEAQVGKTYLVMIDDHNVLHGDEKVEKTRQLLVLLRVEQ